MKLSYISCMTDRVENYFRGALASANDTPSFMD